MPIYNNVTALKAKGWTDASIRDYLGDEDELRIHPQYGSLIRLYLADRVAAAEASTEFLAWRERNAKRRAGAQAAVATKTKRTMDMIDAAIKDLVVPVMAPRPLVEAALRSWRSVQIEHGRDGDASLDSDAMFLERISLNYIRHQLTAAYDQACCDLYAKVGRDMAYNHLRGIIDSAIGEAYPNLLANIFALQYEDEETEPIIQAKPRTDCYQSWELKLRGWTRGMIRSIGREGDARIEATKFDTSHPIWLRSHVEAVEATEEWQARRRELNEAAICRSLARA